MKQAIKTIIKSGLSQLKLGTVGLSIIAVIAAGIPSVSMAGRIDEPPTAVAIVGDIMTRPIMAGATAIGTGLFLVTLPFSLLGGNAGQVGDTLVVKPFQATFLRCLGCTNSNADSFGGRHPVE